MIDVKIDFEELEKDVIYADKFGIRDDMTIHFLNFNKFKQKYKNIANDLLVLLNDVISETAKYSTDNGNDLLNITIVIES